MLSGSSSGTASTSLATSNSDSEIEKMVYLDSNISDYTHFSIAIYKVTNVKSGDVFTASTIGIGGGIVFTVK